MKDIASPERFMFREHCSEQGNNRRFTGCRMVAEADASVKTFCARFHAMHG